MSESSGIVELMFDTMFADTSDAGVIAAVEECARAEAAAAARRLAAIAELVRRRCADDDTAKWACDAWDFAAAEVAAALGISHGRASGQMHIAEALRLRLSRVAESFLAGGLSAQVVGAIAWRTNLVTDTEAMALIDSALADRAPRWNALSQYKLEQAIDTWIDKHDPGALRRTRVNARSRDVTIGAQNHESGTAALWGRLYASDATLLEHRLETMARSVCEDDPRTVGQRRADALGTLAAGSHELACRCGNSACPSAGPDARATSVIVHVLADAEALDAQADSGMSGDDDTGSAAAQPGSAVLVGGGVLPTPLLAELIGSGATTRQLSRPSDVAEPHYRPSRALDEFVRLRDLTCRFPNCDRPAHYCDIDHAVPWPIGPTHASNLRTLCRKHHLLKTFWSDEDGWRDRQFPDGTIVWTSPTGKTHVTRPGSRLLFPLWDSATPQLTVCHAGTPGAYRGVMMPTRRRTRTADRAYRTACERALNDARVAERTEPPPF